MSLLIKKEISQVSIADLNFFSKFILEFSKDIKGLISDPRP